MTGDGSDLLVVGAGLFGLTVAREAAERHGLSVTVIDRRAHLGGNAFDRADPHTGILVHPYGSHIFHTSNATVMGYLETNAALTLNDYRHQVFSTVTRRATSPGPRPRPGAEWVPRAVVPMPVTLSTINTLRLSDGLSPLTPAEARAWLDSQTHLYRDSDEDTRGFEDSALATYGPLLYHDLIRGYTEKQWGIPPRDLPRSTIARIPAPHTTYRQPGYFPRDRWQGIPRHGYAQLAAALADHPGIHLRLGYDHLDPSPTHHAWTKARTLGQIPTVFTGPPDAYFEYRHGPLGWRTIDLEWEHPPTADFQGTAVMNYPQMPPQGPAFTRVHEFRHLHPERQTSYPTDRTVIARETSRAADVPAGDEPYYPVRSPSDTAILRAYRQLAADTPSVAFGGRLGSYLYFDMDMAVAAALSFADNTLPDLIATHPRQARDAAPTHA